MEFTRKELYEKIWTKPMTHVAKEVGLSDVGLGKVCKKHNIPKPSLGYWAKIAHGYKIKKPRLPALEKGASDRIIIIGYVPPKPPLDEKQLDVAQREVNRVNKIIASVSVADSDEAIHSLIIRARKNFSYARTLENGILLPQCKYHLDLKVTKDSLDRALSILNGLFKLLDQCEYAIKIKKDLPSTTEVNLLGETL